MLGTMLRGRYKVIKPLGQGGFGETYRAEDIDLPGNPQCVVKRLKPQSTDPIVLQNARRLFEQEANVLYKLGTHDQVPQLLAHFQENGEFYLVQEFIEGQDLSHELTPGKRFSEEQVITLLQDVLKVLEFVHQQNAIHRDIKPANLIRRKQDGKLVLIDFGAVKEIKTVVSSVPGHAAATDSLTVMIGTNGYMPKEQREGEPKFNSDIYALGMMAIQALTGISPTQFKKHPQTDEVIWREQASVSDRLAVILDKMVRSHFSDRYQSASEVLKDLRTLETPPEIAVAFPKRLVLSVLATVGLGFFGLSISKFFPSLQLSAQLFSTSTSPSVSPTPTTLPSTPPANLSPSTPTSPVPTPTIPANIFNLLNRGIKLYYLGRYEDALATFDKAIELKSDVPAAWNGRGIAMYRLQRYDEALAAFDKAIELKPDFPEAWMNRGLAFNGMRRYDEALVAFDKAIELKSNIPEAWNGRGSALRGLQRDYDASAAYDRAIKLKSDFPEAWNNRAVVMNRLQLYDEALVAADKAIELKPDFPEALVNRAAALNGLKRHKEALVAADKAIQLKPDIPQAWINRSWALGELQRYNEALAAADKAIQLKTDAPDAWNNRGYALEKLQRYDEAIAAYNKAIEIKPDYQLAINNRKLLQKKLGQ